MHLSNRARLIAELRPYWESSIITIIPDRGVQRVTLSESDMAEPERNFNSWHTWLFVGLDLRTNRMWIRLFACRSSNNMGSVNCCGVDDFLFYHLGNIMGPALLV